MNDKLEDSIEARCRAQNPVEDHGRFSAGTIFGDWRVTAFIGSGGNGEVYCAEHVALGTPAAVKVLARGEPHAKVRFEREARTLAVLKSPAFPRFYAYGEANGTAYFAMELLEPGELPKGDKAVAKFMVRLCDAVAELHEHGLVHRDIKPGNILWRKSEPVLSDLGLVKEIAHPCQSVSQLPDDRITLGGVGTPGYGAPEQMERGEATEASDIHSLGVLADRCFDGNPSRTWARIVERATSSIPARRYSSVVALAGAIRRRNLLRTAIPCLSIAAILGIFVTGAFVLLGPVAVEPDGEAIGNDGGEGLWHSMCERGVIESVEKKYIPIQTSKSEGQCWRVEQITNVVEGTLVRLQAETVVFSEPIVLAPGTYRIMGPGRLDADISGSTNVVVRLRDCVLNNLTVLPYPKNGIRYVFEGGAYLNFARLKRGDMLNRNIEFSGEEDDVLEFGGPLTREELMEKRQADWEREVHKMLDRENAGE